MKNEAKNKSANSIKAFDAKIKQKLEEFRQVRERKCYPLLLGNTSIGQRVVDDVFDDLRRDFRDCNGCLDVVIDSSGGDIDCAYNLALLLRRFGTKDLTFFVPRWAKSAATMLVCSGNKVMMTPVAELGPLDPQITQMNPLERRLEEFSPLHIDATLNLIRDEFQNGNEKLANGLMERLQFPLTLGSFKKSLDIAEEYLSRLLSTRMFIGKEDKAKQIAKTLTTGYADHGFCIDVDEARTIGLEAYVVDDQQMDLLWDLHKLNREKGKIKAKQKRKELQDLLKTLPPELIDKLPPGLKGPIEPMSLP